MLALEILDRRMSREVREYSRQRDTAMEMDMECEVAQRVLGGTNRAETQSAVSGLACSSYGSNLDRAKSDFRLTAAQRHQPSAGRLVFVALELKSAIWRDNVFFFSIAHS